MLAEAWLAAGRSPAPRRAAGPRRVRAAALGAGAAALALAAGWVLAPGPVTGGGHSRPSTDSAAAAVLLTAAVHVQAAPAATAGRYWHTSICIGGLFRARPPGTPRTAAGSLAMQLDRWVASSTSDATWFSFSSSCGPGSPLPHKADPRDWGQRRFDVEGRDLTITELAQLRTDPAALRVFLLAPYPAGYQQSHPAQLVQRLFGEAADLTAAPVQPAVRAAVCRLLAGLPGIEVLGPVQDAAGRTGTAIAIPDGQVLHELIIDLRTGAVLDTEDVTRAHGQTTIVSYDAILVSGWTDTVTPAPSAPSS